MRYQGKYRTFERWRTQPHGCPEPSQRADAPWSKL